MIEGRARADAHEFRRSDLDHGNSRIILKMRNDMVGHFSEPQNLPKIPNLASVATGRFSASSSRAHHTDAASRFLGDWRVLTHPHRLLNSTQSQALRKAFFGSSVALEDCARKSRSYLSVEQLRAISFRYL